ncbi:hypothetical protein Scep_020895 [Stephania cephalantha]|uniref:Uncharacterized protein n=1 Tax=Stephania cephalantha TaxID=152367 RepID=A0AAP0F3K3_9MAGN
MERESLCIALHDRKSRDGRGSSFCDELNTSEDGDYCGSDEGTSEESSDDDTR